jgi:hypothetical protein
MASTFNTNQADTVLTLAAIQQAAELAREHSIEEDMIVMHPSMREALRRAARPFVEGNNYVCAPDNTIRFELQPDPNYFYGTFDMDLNMPKRENPDMKYKGIMSISMEALLEAIGITTDDAEIANISFNKLNDTVNIIIRSKEQSLPLGDGSILCLRIVGEGEEIPHVTPVPPEMQGVTERRL